MGDIYRRGAYALNVRYAGDQIMKGILYLTDSLPNGNHGQVYGSEALSNLFEGLTYGYLFLVLAIKNCAIPRVPSEEGRLGR